MAPNSVTLDASSIRPSRSISPSSSRERASASPAGGRRSAGATGSGYSLIGLGSPGRARSAAVAVLPGADVAGRVEGQRAQRAGGAAGGDDAAGGGAAHAWPAPGGGQP